MRRALFVLALGTLLLSVVGLAQAHRQGLREGYHPGVYDCAHDWGWESGHPEDLGHDLVTVDLTEREEAGKPLLIFELNFVQAMSVLGQRPTYEMRETLSFAGPRGAFSTTLRTTDETTFTLVEGEPPAYIGPRKAGLATGAEDRSQGEPDARLIAVDVGYSYSQIRAQNGEHVRDIQLVGHYQSATGRWMRGDVLPGGTTSPSGEDEPACLNGAHPPEADKGGYHVSPPFRIEKSDWSFVPPPNRPPVAAFSFAPEAPTVDATVTFHDASGDPEGDIARWSWSFGDGATSAERSPRHAYREAGEFAVRLVVTDGSGATASAERVVRVVRPAHQNLPPLPDFTWTPLEPRSHENVTFVDASTDPDGSIASRTWSVEGRDATAASWTRAFSPGLQNVTLTVRDNDGAERSVTKSVTVLNRPPIANATIAPTPAIAGRPVEFRDASEDLDGSIVAATWRFGDGVVLHGPVVVRTPTSPGESVVRLSVRDDMGAVASRELRFDVLEDTGAQPPSAAFHVVPPVANVSETVAFARVDARPGETATWRIGNESRAEGDTVRHAFARGGLHAVHLVVRDARGIENSSVAWVRIVDQPPVGGFRVEPREPRVREPVRFIDDARDPEGGPLSSMWRFGDAGLASFDPEPTHAYAAPGRYEVVRRATDIAGNVHDSTLVIDVLPVANLAPWVDFEAEGEGPLVVGASRALASRAFDPDGILRRWEWSDGERVGEGPRWTLTPSRAGPVTVTLRVWDDAGAYGEATRRFVVQPRPLGVGIVASEGDAAGLVTLHASATHDVVAWEWHFADGSISRAPMAKRVPAGVEAVRLVVTDRDGQVATADALIGADAPLERSSQKKVPAPGVGLALAIAAAWLPRGRRP